MRKENPKSYEYIETLITKENLKMGQSRVAAESIGLSAISLSAAEGQILQFFVSLCIPKKVVEIGTLTGLSAQYILAAMPADGILWTLEKSEKHAQLAVAAIDDKRCRIIIGDAVEKLDEVKNYGPFNCIFIDGNKASYLKYFTWACENISMGGYIIVDNVFLSGAVWGDASVQKFNEKQIDAVRAVNLKAFSTDGFASTIIPTLEGLLVCRKT